MPKKIAIILLGAFLLGFHLPDSSNGIFTEYCQASEYADEGKPIGMANPAASYCIEMGYEYKIMDEPSGQRGICIFPDGSQCDAWDFLKGKCGEMYSYCTKNGYDMEIRTDGKNPFSREYAVCISQKGDVVGSVTDLTGISEKCGKGISPPPEYDDKKSVGEPSLGLQVPTSFDWRSYNGYDWMTSVKNQGGCGSCWAFGAVGAVEAVYNIRFGNPYLDLNLSEEYLVSDCLNGNSCCGGWHDRALQYIMEEGIPDEGCMPYVDGFGCECFPDTCRDGCDYKGFGVCSNATCSDRCADWQSRLMKIGYTGYVPYNPGTIKENVICKGPLSVAMGIGSTYGGYWDGDIYRCTNDNGVNHCVVVLGYDEAEGCWIVKNSWGSGWNGDGYFKVGYGECQIERYVYYADTLNCGCTIACNTVLNKDLVNCSGDGLTIFADGVTLDCNGHTISGDSTGHGISVSGKNNVAIKNCVVQGFEEGIHIYSSSGDTLTYNMVNYNSSYGVRLDSTSVSIITNNIVNSNNGAGISLLNSFDNTLTSNYTNRNSDGILLDSCYGIILTENTADSNLNTGISLHNSFNNNLILNFTRYNNDEGILITRSSDNSLFGNEANHNNSGIYLEYSSGDTLDVNTANNNSTQGISLGKGSENNILTDNYTYNNSQGILLDSSSNNTLSGNTADSNLQGIYLKNTYGDTLTENNVNNNDRGIVLDGSSNNVITNNYIMENTEYGAYLNNSSQYNTFWGNEFTDNGENAFETESASDNNWNLVYAGNNWSDCLTNPGFPYYYQIARSGDGVDYYPECALKLGDSNGDGERNVSDVIYCINYLFKGGPAPDPLEIADANCDGEVNVSDVVYMVNYLFKGGPPPGC